MKISQLPKANEWTKWFAWYPIKTIDEQIVWFEIVERKEFHCKQDNVYPSYWIIYRRIQN